MMALLKICFILVILGSTSAQPNPDPTWNDSTYLNWLYTNFRNVFWHLGSTTRQFAVITVGRLTQFPQVDAYQLPVPHGEEWNAAYFNHTGPGDHTEPVLLENARSIIIDHIQETGGLPTNIYLYTHNIPCPDCTFFIIEHIRDHIPNAIREFLGQNPQYNINLNDLRNINYHIGWTLARGNIAITEATLAEFAELDNNVNEPALTVYPGLTFTGAFECNINNGRKKRHSITLWLSQVAPLTTKWEMQSPLRWKHISAGLGGVWGVGLTGEVFYKTDTYLDSSSAGVDWEAVYGRTMTQLSVGYNCVWAVDSADKIYRRDGITEESPTGTSWTLVSGMLQHVSVSRKGNIWGVNVNGRVYKRTGNHWTSVSGTFTQVTVGSTGVWAVKSNGEIYHRTSTYGDEDTLGGDWCRIDGKLKYISSADGMLWGIGFDDKIYYRLGQTPNTPLGISWVSILGRLKQISVSNRGLWGVTSGSYAFGRLSAFGFDLTDWEHIPGKAKHISTGFAGVWRIDINGYLFYRQSTYAAGSNSKGSGEWENVAGRLEQLDVGHRVVWGVNRYGQVYVRLGISLVKQTGNEWKQIYGIKLKCVSVSPAGHVWGVNDVNIMYRRVGANNKTPLGTSWEVIAWGFDQVSTGRAGVWGVSINNHVYYRGGTTGDVYTEGSGWTLVGTMKIKYISSGPRCVRAVDLNNNIYYRSGMSITNPSGTSWIKSDLIQLKQIETYDADNGIWGVSPEGYIIARKF